jgi:hypothetical protein
LIVLFTLRNGKANPFDALVVALQQCVRSDEPDTLRYDFHAVPGNPNARPRRTLPQRSRLDLGVVLSR